MPMRRGGRDAALTEERPDIYKVVGQKLVFTKVYQGFTKIGVSVHEHEAAQGNTTSAASRLLGSPAV